MARKPEGGMTAKQLGDGTTAFQLRFRAHGERERVTLHERRDCPCGCGGGWTPATVQVELANILARVQAGIWRRNDPARAAAGPAERCPSFHEYASMWLAAKRQGAYGDTAIDDTTHARLLWALRLYLLPFFAKHRLDDIDRDACMAFKAKLLADADDLRQAQAAGAKLKHRNGRRARPLSASSMRKIIDTLAQILDDAVEDDHIATNPARAKRMRIRVPRPARTFLEQDELALMLDAAARLDGPTSPPRPSTPAGKTAGRVAELAATGLRAKDIAARLGLAKATVSYHLARLDTPPAAAYVGRRAIVATLGYAGPRVSELVDLRIGQLRLHDPDGARFRILDAKTPTGIREVEISPDLVEVLVEHIDRLRRAGAPTGPDDYAFPNLRGGHMTRQRAAEIVHDVATEAGAAITTAGLPPLPNVTPHTLRRTYVSIALLASSFDIRWVMAQVGHADSSMTLDVYAQLQQREQREHGPAFDAKIRAARDRLPRTPAAANGTPNGTRSESEVPDHVPAEWSATS
jgi:integrase